MTHFFRGPERVNQEIDVVCDGRRLGRQSMRLVNPKTSFKLTSLRRDLDTLESHAKRFLEHTKLRHVLWANITLGEVAFVVISRR